MDPMGYTRIGLDFFYYKSSLHTTTIGPLGLRVFLMTIGQSFANHGVLSLGSGGTLLEKDPVTSLEGDDYMIHVVPQSRTWMSQEVSKRLISGLFHPNILIYPIYK